MHRFTRILIALSTVPSLSLTWISAFGIASPFGTLATTIVLVTVSPASAAVAPGNVHQFSAIATYSNGRQEDVTRRAAWSSSDDSLVTASAGGRVAGISKGSAEVLATCGATSGSASVQVKGPALASLSVAPASVAMDSGKQMQLKATGVYEDGSSADLTPALAWTSSDSSVAAVSQAGQVRAVNRGSSTVQAAAGPVVAATSVNVSGPALQSIEISPAATSLKNRSSARFTATGQYDNGATADLTHSVVWTTSSASTATVTQTGEVAALSPGATHVHAVAGSVAGSAALSVLPANADQAGCDGKGNCYVFAGAKGSGSGADWTNAYTGFGPASGQVDPGSMARGVTYWVAAGRYGAQTFATPDRGDAVITIKGVTSSSHGPAQDWNSAFAGLADFGVGSSRILTNYWTFDGQARGDDWQSGYTIRFDLNGEDTHGGVITNRTITGAASHLRFDYIDVRGSNTNYAHNSGSTSNCRQFCDSGFATGSPTVDLYVGHSWIHDVGDTQFQSNINTSGNSNGSDWIIEYNYISRDHTGDQSAGNHSEAFSSTVQNMIVRYNYFQDIISSGVITDASGGTPDVGPWYIYGNIVFWTDNAVMNGTAAGLGDGFVSMFGETMHGTSYIVGNTIANLGRQSYCSRQGTACATYFLYTIGEDSGTPTWEIQNNLVWKVDGRCVYGAPKGWTFHADYNSSFQSPGFSNCGRHAQNEGGKNPFVNWSGGGDQLVPFTNLDFSLANPTSPGSNAFSKIPPGCTPGVNCADVSMKGIRFGISGNYDRGAVPLEKNPKAASDAKKPK